MAPETKGAKGLSLVDDAASKLRVGETITDKFGDTYTASKHLVNDRMGVRNISKNDIIDAMKNPLKITETKLKEAGNLLDHSQRYIGEKATVIVNPAKNTLVSGWQTAKKIVEKLTHK